MTTLGNTMVQIPENLHFLLETWMADIKLFEPFLYQVLAFSNEGSVPLPVLKISARQKILIDQKVKLFDSPG
jgi:hypothetical protein